MEQCQLLDNILINPQGKDGESLDLKHLLTELDISSNKNIEEVFSNANITHIIACGYQMSNMIDANPVRASEINILGLANLFESVAKYKIKRMIFPSSQSVYGNAQNIYGNKAVHEDDCNERCR